MSVLLTPEATAKKLSVSVRTLKEWRRNKYGPPSLRLSHTKIRYREEDLDAWLTEQGDQHD